MFHRTLFQLGIVIVLAFFGSLRGDEKVLYETVSAYNHIFVTEDDEGLRSLLFEKDGALQSVVKVGDPDHLELPYARAMLVGVAFVEEPKRVLIVGLGGGTIPQFLHKHYPTMKIDVVEIDPEVVAVAKKFFGVREDPLLSIHVDDGRKFIEKCRKPYDIIFLDAFGFDNIPYHLATREFLTAVRKALSPKGVVVGNLWSRFSNPLYDAMVRTYQDVFDELYIFRVRDSGNRILVPLPRKNRVRRGELAARGSEITKAQTFPFDLGDVVTYGFRRATRRDFGDRVLKDADAPKEKSDPLSAPLEEAKSSAN